MSLRSRMSTKVDLTPKRVNDLSLIAAKARPVSRYLGPTPSGRFATNPHTLDSRNNLANAYQDAGRTAEAIRLHEQNLADRETGPRRRPPPHPAIAQQPCRCQGGTDLTAEPLRYPRPTTWTCGRSSTGWRNASRPTC